MSREFLNLNRRSFLGLLLPISLLAACKKSLPRPEIPRTDPGADLYPDMGTYGSTELSDQLYIPSIDISKIFHGYTDKISYNAGDTVSMFLSGPPANNQQIVLSDANGNQVLSFNTAVDFQAIGSSKPWVDGFMYNKTTDLKLPDNLKSGFYRFNGDIPLVCKGNISASDITVIFPSNTFNAYNYYGGKSLYKPTDPAGNAYYRATVLSFLRYNPVSPEASGNFSEHFFRWIEKQNYNVRFIADIDLEDYSQIANSKLVIITGKSEYWTRQARLNIDKFVASGKNLLILSGDTMYWQARYNLKKNLMICYKSNDLDPLQDTIYSTCLWDDPILKYPETTSIGANFNGGGYPMMVTDPLNGFKIVQDNSPLFSGTGLKQGDLLNLPTIETDGAPVLKMILPGSDEIPIIDNAKLGFDKAELLGYTFTLNPEKQPGLGTFLVFRKTPASGTIVNVASTNWCSVTGMGGADKAKIETITKNMIDLSLAGSSLFSG